MKTLLIDNYDSFTFNLFQLVARVTGEQPLVVRNDDWHAWESLAPGSVDATIISPGPGTPTRAEDFGISALALQQTAPLLGVCLGHQGLSAAEGAAIVRAPEPMHGRTSPIFHSGRGIFRGLPSPFNVVRYHSLLAVDIPPALTVTASTPSPVGDLVMGVEHVDKPQWGVQFHPESILTEHGAQLMANFFELARERRSVTLQAPASEPERPANRAAWSGASWPTMDQASVAPAGPAETTTAPNLAPNLELLTRRVPANASAQGIYEQLFASRKPSFWLDSSSAPALNSRFSIIGGMGPLGEWVSAEAGQGVVTVTAADGGVRQVPGDMFSYLRAQLIARRLPENGFPFDFSLGYVGYLGYEMKADSGAEKLHATDLPDASFVFCDRAVVLDHETGEAWILTLSAGADRQQALAWLQEAERTVRQPPTEGMPSAAPTAVIPQPVDVIPRHSDERYRDLVLECQEEIKAGESYEICLTNEFTVTAAVDPLETFRVLRQVSPVPYGAYLSLPGAAVLSASPERFLRISADGHVQTKPIKGTRPRGATPEEDAALIHDLATAEKDQAENLMIVDLLRNDLGVVAEVGSVHVPKLFAVESFATVHQLVSTVEARLSPEFTAVDCVRAAFPGGSMTGAPKLRTMQIIDRLEAGSRGIYSGTIGYFSLTGAADLNIVIRTLVVYPDHVTVGAGGAIVSLSDPQDEVDEMKVKARAPISAVLAVATGTAPNPLAVFADSPEESLIHR